MEKKNEDDEVEQKEQEGEKGAKLLTTALSSSLVPLFSAARTMEEMRKKNATPAEYRKSCKRRTLSMTQALDL